MVFIVLLTSSLSKAQVKTPQPSPHAVLSQTVGLTEVVIDYSRPSAKGRIIFGDLVPFGKLWRTGANANTTISFSEEVVGWPAVHPDNDSFPSTVATPWGE